MLDFTVKIYKTLLKTLINQGFKFQSFSSFLDNPENKVVILRHDVDLVPENSLVFAQIQNELGIQGSYYFRAVPESWDEAIIKQIASLGHEIGYHYESLSTCNGGPDSAILDFKQNLEKLRQLVPVKTICMHGSPRSKFDSRDLWKKYNYHNYGIIGEPYFDIDFSKVLYLSDTGRRWNGEKVSIRDKILNQKNNLADNFQFRTTNQIISALNNQLLPERIMFTFHPQRWTNSPIPWVKELVWQNMKNVVKRIIVILK